MIDNSNIVLDKFQKALMNCGNKANSLVILRELILKISVKKDNPLEVLTLSVNNVKPMFTVSTQKKGKRVLQVPKPILSEDERIAVAANWIVKNSYKHSKGSFVNNFLQEVYDSFNNQGFSKKQQQELNKLVVINRSAL